MNILKQMEVAKITEEFSVPKPAFSIHDGNLFFFSKQLHNSLFLKEHPKIWVIFKNYSTTL